MKLPAKDKKKLDKLTEKCKKSQGEYVLSTHGEGSWATTYSYEFIDAAAEIYVLFKKAGAYSPIGAMATHFMENDIKSCRGSKMFTERVQYLYDKHLKQRVNNLLSE